MNRTNFKKKVIMIILFLMLFCIMLEKVPVKRSISEEEADNRISEDGTYLCEFTATTGSSWNIRRHPDEIPQSACLKGNVPFDALNHGEFFFFAHNMFLIQGEVIGKRFVDAEGNIKDYYGDDMAQCFADMQLLDERCECYDIINVSQWDIIEPITRGDSLRFFAPKKYLSIWDFNWKAIGKEFKIGEG